MRARNVGEICGGQVDDLQAATTSKSAGREPAGLRRPTRSAERRSGASEGQGRRGLWLGNWGLSRDPTEKTSQNSKAGRLGPATLISKLLARRHFRADPARILSLIYAANLRLRAPRISSLTAVIFASGRNLTFKRSATTDASPGSERSSGRRVHPQRLSARGRPHTCSLSD